MRKQYSRIAALVMALTAGGLAAFALKPAPGNTAATLAARNPAVEVRTQVIRRTIHVIRHEPGARLRGSRGSGALVVAGRARPRAAATRASGAHAGGTGQSHASAVPVATRSSGSHSAAASPSPAAQSHPVSTRSSGSHSTAAPSAPTGQSHPVSTRTSGAHGSTSNGSSGTAAHPVTRSSGGGHGHGGDGGDGGGRDD